MKLTQGTCDVNGKIAFVPQQSWIFSGTVRDNIVMGSDIDKDWYNHVIDVCALARDFQLLEQGDMTEVGERGITLSGGQKQRISLARALYSKADIYLLDDPLSAVDAKVGQHIFQKYILETLKDKTVVLVSHGMQYLKECENVIFMKDGQIAEVGDPKILLEDPDTNLSHMANFDYKRKDENKRDKNKTGEDFHVDEEEAHQKTTKEEENKSSSSFLTLMKFLRYCGHPIIMTIIFAMLVLFIVLRSFERIFLQIWMKQGDGREMERRMNETFVNATDHALRGYINHNPELWKYQLGYSMVNVGMLLCGLLKVKWWLVKG